MVSCQYAKLARMLGQQANESKRKAAKEPGPTVEEGADHSEEAEASAGPGGDSDDEFAGGLL